MHSENSAMKWL